MITRMKASCILIFCLCTFYIGYGQGTSAKDLTLIKSATYTPVKNQANSGTCWSFSMTSLIETQTIKNGFGEFDLSEMFTVRNTYLEKARNYMLRQGAAQFGPGGLGHDVINAIAHYGAVPENVYSGLTLGEKRHNHAKMDTRLKLYLDSLLTLRPVPADWITGFTMLLDDHLGRPPEKFQYREKQYTPLSFATEVLHFNAADYVYVTSFTHHPYYTSFALEVPDNFSNGIYYNLPLSEMIGTTERALELGYSVMWDADVSNKDFRQENGYAMLLKNKEAQDKGMNPDADEQPVSPSSRQALFEDLTTQDDHLMHVVGLEKSVGGKKFFLVKNSWGEVGPWKGFIHVSEAYFAINTISLVLPKAVLDPALLTKLKLNE